MTASSDEGLRDFWSTYEKHYDAILAATMRAAEEHADFGPLVRAMTAVEIAEENARSRALLERAIAGGDWGPYESDLRAQGAAYARTGVSFASWHDLVGSFRRIVVPLLVEAYASTPARLTAALCSMDDFAGRALRTIGEEYLATRERDALEQREIASDYAEVLEHLVDAVNVLDREGRYITLNAASERMQGFTRDEVVGEAIWDVLPDIVGNPFHEALLRVRDRGGHEIFEMHYPRWKRWFEVQVYAVKRGVVSISRDVTERKAAEQLGRFFTLSLDMLCIAAPDGHFQRVNPAFGLLGYAEEEITSRPFLEFVHPDDKAATLAEVEKLARGEMTIHFENRYRCKDGSYRWLAWTSAPDASGSLYAAARDVTDRKRAEEELRRAKEEAEGANRELEAFSYSVAHDLRAPLRGINGFSQALLEDWGDRLDPEAKDYLERIAAGAQRMGVLIDALLGLSRLTRAELRRERIDVTALARSVFGQLASVEPERGGAVALDVAENVVALGDPHLVRVVFENLLGNAWKFTRRSSPARITVGVTKKNGEDVYFVRDNGAGFDMVYAGKLFAPFQRLHASTEFAGTGIGLATVQRVVARHGGRIWAESRVGEGATFFFTLQRATTRDD